MSALAGRRRTEYRHWTPKEDKTLAILYREHPITEISRRMGRGTGSIYNRVQKLGLKRTDEYKAISEGNRFKPGGKPWNKGLKGWQAGGKSKDTQFKPGVKPSNTWRPIGAERTSKDGILYRKVSDTGDKKTDWKAVQVLIWEEHNGPLPAGHIVVLKDRNRENLAPDNLIAISRADNMHRNSIAVTQPSIDRPRSPSVGSTASSKSWRVRMKNLNDLRDILGRTMEGVLDGKYTIEQAKAVAQVAAEVNATARLEVDMARATDGDFKGSGFIDVDPRIPKRQEMVGRQ